MTSRRQGLPSPGTKPLPLEYRVLLARGLPSIPPWHFIRDPARAQSLREEFLREVGAGEGRKVKDFWPFARHQAQDDFAGFVLEGGEPTAQVAIVHLTWTGRKEQPSFPSVYTLPDFITFLAKEVLPEAPRFMDEGDELEDYSQDE